MVCFSCYLTYETYLAMTTYRQLSSPCQESTRPGKTPIDFCMPLASLSDGWFAESLPFVDVVNVRRCDTQILCITLRTEG